MRSWNLASEDPANTRWMIKLRTSKGLFVVKTTNNSKTFLYTLEDIDAEFNRVKQFSLAMTRYLTNFSEANNKKKLKKRG